MSLSVNNLNTAAFGMERTSNQKKLLESRIRGALWGLFSGDALAAPTHWYYGGFPQIVSDYGRNGIVDYTKPKLHLAGSIMNKSNVNGGGRGAFSLIKLSQGGGEQKAISIIGDVINHGKRDYWDPKYGIHYHATLEKGENTLEAQLVRVLMKSIVQNHGRIHVPHFVQSYITFMTTPGSHNDTYASTCHRMFFSNLIVKKLPPEDCPDNDHHNVDTIDGLILPTIAAIAVCANGGTVGDARDAAAKVASATRRSNVLEETSRAWSDLVYDVLNPRQAEDENQDLSSSVKTTAKYLRMPSPRDNGRDQMRYELCNLSFHFFYAD
jgi:ADP-ribosyl-[dinitrogen reductase] hydrolase